MAKLPLLLVFLLSYLNASLDLRVAHIRHAERVEQEIVADPIAWDRFVPQAHLPLLVDMLWVRSLIEVGDFRRAGRPVPNTLIDRGLVMAGYDPLFRGTYEWIPAAFLIQRFQTTEEELLHISRLLDVGVASLQDSELPFSAALNFIGYSSTDDSERRKREIRVALNYLAIAQTRPQTPEVVPALTAALTRRLSQLEGIGASNDEQFYENLLLTMGHDALPNVWKMVSEETKARVLAKAGGRVVKAHRFEYLPPTLEQLLVH